jgi:hypothetical protein
MRRKQDAFKKKHATYIIQVHNYNKVDRRNQLNCPTFEEVKASTIDDPFWNVGPLNHTNEPWAMDPTVKQGIQAFLSKRSCTEELRRIGREIRQMLHAALGLEKKFDALLEICNSGEWF